MMNLTIPFLTHNHTKKSASPPQRLLLGFLFCFHLTHTAPIARFFLLHERGRNLGHILFAERGAAKICLIVNHEQETNWLIDITLSRLVQERGITEELKAADPLRWVQEMNNAKMCAEELVLKDIIYC